MSKIYDSQNVFAKILRKEIPCREVYADDHALAFHDINPQASVHVLVIPRVAAVDWEQFARVATPQQQVGFVAAIGKVIAQLSLDQGYRLIVNAGVHGGQEVAHLHVHILGGRSLGSMLGASSTPATKEKSSR